MPSSHQLLSLHYHITSIKYHCRNTRCWGHDSGIFIETPFNGGLMLRQSIPLPEKATPALLTRDRQERNCADDVRQGLTCNCVVVRCAGDNQEVHPGHLHARCCPELVQHCEGVKGVCCRVLGGA